MPKSRNAEYRNSLYEEPSVWGALVAVGLLFAFGVVVLIILLN